MLRAQSARVAPRRADRRRSPIQLLFALDAIASLDKGRSVVDDADRPGTRHKFMVLTEKIAICRFDGAVDGLVRIWFLETLKHQTIWPCYRWMRENVCDVYFLRESRRPPCKAKADVLS